MRSPFPTGSTISERYQIVQPIAADSDFVTYNATDLTSNQAVIVRELQLPAEEGQQLLPRLYEEAQALAQLSHAGIPRYLESLHLLDGDVLRFVDVQQAIWGQNLAQKVLDGWRPDETELRELATQLLEILGYIRGQAPPVVHRDIRPEHILLGQDDGRVSLVGFGGMRDLYHETVSGGTRWVGQPGYMAPERVRGQSFPSSDLYALGGVLIYTLTRSSPAQLPQRRLKADFRRQAQVSESLAQWIDRLQEPLVEERLQSPDEALVALQRPVPMEDATRPSRGGPLIPVLIAGNAVLALLLIIFIALYAGSSATPAAPAVPQTAPATTPRAQSSASAAVKRPSNLTRPGAQPGAASADATAARLPANAKRSPVDILQPPVRPNHSLGYSGGGYFRTEAADTLLLPKRAVSLETWFRVSPQGRAEVDLPAKKRPSLLLVMVSSGDERLYLQLHDRAVTFGGVGRLDTPRMVKYGEWHHVAGTFDFKTRTLRVYFDGSLMGTAKGLKRKQGDAAAATVTIGAPHGSNKPPQGFAVSIDEVRYWGLRRSEKQISAALEYELSGRERGLKGYWTFNEGQGKRSLDRSPAHHDGALTGAGAAPSWGRENPF